MPRVLHGRRVLLTDVSDINANNVIQVLNDIENGK